MIHDIPLKGGSEQDALTGWKNFIKFKCGERKKIKRLFNRRERRYIRRKIKEKIPEYIEEAYEEEK
jgi:hypothetical protein